ncbi:MAG TPA: hypothetical protein VHM19_10200, partial [Polyangiales bacterium]|nr:hypothetical protein [Polyangiales bacterium]
LTQAEETFRNHCPGSTAEVRSCRQLSAWLTTQLGFEDLSRTEQWMREAEERDDAIGARRLRLLSVLAALVADDTAKAELRIRGSRADGPLDPNDVISLLAIPARMQLHLYRHEPHACRTLLDEIEKMFTSPLCAVRVWRASNHLAYARVGLVACAEDGDPEPTLERVEAHLAQLEALNLPQHADHARLLRAECAQRRGQSDEALRLLDAILKDDEQAADGAVVLAAARLCKARLCTAQQAAEATALREAAHSAMRSRGIENPIAFARLYAPAFDTASAAHG